MKKILLCVLAAALTVGLTACGPDEGEEKLVSLYRGSLDRKTYEIKVWGGDDRAWREGADMAYRVEFCFKNDYPEEKEQIITYELEHLPYISTIRQGLQIVDVNGDGSDDLLMDLGLTGQIKIALCLVYDEESDDYIIVEGFTELAYPCVGYRDLGEVVIWGYDTPGSHAPGPNGKYECWSEYIIEGTELIHLGTYVESPELDSIFFHL